MNPIRAIGFDLFNTLITAEAKTLDEALDRLTHSLRQSGLAFDPETFKEAHWDAAVRFVEETRQKGKETHNRFWISAALKTLGYSLPPTDSRIASAVDAYFSAFLQYCHLIPGTTSMLEALMGRYRLGLLSNFTHGPAARQIMDRLDLTPFFQVVLISGEMGYCKPHPLVFHRLVDQLGAKADQLIYVGDDLEYDIMGAQRAGIKPVWMTYANDRKGPFTRAQQDSRANGLDCEVPRISGWKDFLILLDNV
jgi:putative hydrolase of the HAD superfamily